MDVLVEWVSAHWAMIFWVWFISMIAVLSIFPESTDAERKREDCDCAYWEKCSDHEEEDQDIT